MRENHRFARWPALCALAGLVVACSGSQSPAVPALAAFSLHTDRGQSWMHPTKRKSVLVYEGNLDTNDVEVYDYGSGKQVGNLTGFVEPLTGCVDATGDVYITNFGSDTTYEYAHGSKKRINTFTTSGGDPSGCAVDGSGDLAISVFSTASNNAPGEVCLWKHGSGNATCYDGSSTCYYLWPPGYDEKGNLYFEAESESEGASIQVCELAKGSDGLTPVPYGGATIYGAGGLMWDGKYLALTDQKYQNTATTGIYRASETSSGALTIVAGTQLTDTCYGEDTDVQAPFILGKKNTPLNRNEGTVVLGSNGYCFSGIGVWHYPPGGDPYREISTQTEERETVAVSIGE